VHRQLGAHAVRPADHLRYNVRAAERDRRCASDTPCRSAAWAQRARRASFRGSSACVRQLQVRQLRGREATRLVFFRQVWHRLHQEHVANKAAAARQGGCGGSKGSQGVI
jgi:hypothetical protein